MAMVAGIIGAAVSVVGGAKASEDQKALAEEESQHAQAVGRYNAAVKREEGRRVVGAQKAAYGASGVQLDAGDTSGDVIADTEASTYMDALAAYYQGDSQATLITNRGQAASSASMFAGMSNAGSSAYSLLR